MESFIVRWYRNPAFSDSKTQQLLKKLRRVNSDIHNLKTELCFHVEFCRKSDLEVTDHEKNILEWLLQCPLNAEALKNDTTLKEDSNLDFLIEFGPRFNFSTPQSTNAVSVCHSAGLKDVVRVEVSTRYLISFKSDIYTTELHQKIGEVLHDRMTEFEYTCENIPCKSFNESLKKHENVFSIDVLGRGRQALEEINSEMGLAFDDADLDYYTGLFSEILKRNPTNVECFDLAQSNSEHSRHWFFKGRLVIDGNEMEKSLIDMIIDTQEHSNPNNVIKFSDNSSAIQGYKNILTLRPLEAGLPSELIQQHGDPDIIFTAETHNFPTGVAPFAGATTGTGGRIRDVQAVGRGGETIAATAGYCVGNLLIPDYELPWEDSSLKYPPNLASPLEILIHASDGASDYGNKFGEPVICGFARSYGENVFGKRREWVKPIMFSGGLGVMETSFADKKKPEQGMLVCKIGGPAYRIGVGGGAASSVGVQGGGDCKKRVELDFNAVQRGDAEMGQKLNRAVRACVEMNQNNPIASIHDQGAGGNGNVLKELVEPVGGKVYASKFELGDPTLSALELWGAEYQESNALLCPQKSKNLLERACKRERCPLSIVGEVTNTGRMEFVLDNNENILTPFNLDLNHVLGKMPRKIFNLKRLQQISPELNLKISFEDALQRVLRLPSVSSKRYLTNKVDRCVTGLIAQQQCVGPLQVPLADYGATTVSHFTHKGSATSIGEQPIKVLLNSSAGARMTVVEALQNLVFVKISHRKDIKCSGNWMWAPKVEGEGSNLADACKSMCKIMSELGIAIDGGKDSLGMAAKVENEVVLAPPELVVSCYAPCPDVRKKVTPAIVSPSNGKRGALIHIDITPDKRRMGGSALAQCLKQIGSHCPDVENVNTFANAFDLTQNLIENGTILSGHDISDGGLAVCLLEMAFAGFCGLHISFKSKHEILPLFFAEEAGWVIEIAENDLQKVLDTYNSLGVTAKLVGYAQEYGQTSKVLFEINGLKYIDSNLLALMLVWEETSFRLELLQTNPVCATEEYESLKIRTEPKYNLTFNPDKIDRLVSNNIPLVCILREEGTNGDRELAASFVRAGFQTWDVTMSDLLESRITLERFTGLAFPGGFSYADVLGSARGWAAAIKFNPSVANQLETFKNRSDTFSIGICNGCQLMALIGWVGEVEKTTTSRRTGRVYLDHNLSERFECRWGGVKVEQNSKAIMLGGVKFGTTDMRGSILGTWSAHGEGRFCYYNNSNEELRNLEESGCVALRFVDDLGIPTTKYPHNPNGSLGGIAGLCSKDGRHLAMMPHPERCEQMYNWPWKPSNWNYENSPWQTMFANAYNWCINTQS